MTRSYLLSANALRNRQTAAVLARGTPRSRPAPRSLRPIGELRCSGEDRPDSPAASWRDVRQLPTRRALPTIRAATRVLRGRAPASHGPGTAEACKDLAPLGEIPVSKTVPGYQRARHERAAAEHSILLTEKDFRIFFIRKALEAGVAVEPAVGPFPHVT